MKSYKRYRFYLLLIVFAGLFLNSCTKKDAPIKPDNLYFLSNEFKTSITSQQAVSNFSKLSPDAAFMRIFVKTDVEVQKLVYKTTFQNANIQASGLVCLPKAAGTYPILCFQNGTNTLHSQAPTEAFNDDLFSIIESVASMGFIVVIPDYIGFGASSNFIHPYLHAESSTNSILDMLRAVKELGNDEKIIAKPTKDLFIFGYSQGGWATMQLQKTIETNYASEFNLIASSCGAGPYSIEAMNSYIISQPKYPMPYFLAYMLNAYTSMGLVANPLSNFIQAPYAAKIPGLFDGEHTGGSINVELTTKMANFLTIDYQTEFTKNTKFASLESALIANSIVPWNVSTPTRLYHGVDDEVIPFGMSQKILADFKTAGVPDSKIELIAIPGADHTSGVYPAGLQTILWFLTLKK